MKSISRVAIVAVLALSIPFASVPGAAAAPGLRLRAATRDLTSPLRRIERELQRTGHRVSRGLTGSFRVSGSPYRWGFSVFLVGERWLMQVAGFQEAATGAQIHSWTFRLPLGAAAVAPNLEQGRVDTGTALGAFGKVRLTYAPSDTARDHVERCPSTGDVVFRDRVRRGTLSGSLGFTPNEGTLPDLLVTSMRARAVKLGSTGAACPGTGGPGHHCAGPGWAIVSDPAQDASVSGVVGQGFASMTASERLAPATVTHTIFADAPAPTRVFRSTPTGLAMDADPMAPLLSGSLRFTTGTVASHAGARCVITRTAQDWSSGTVTAAFDSGAIDLTGAGLRAAIWTTAKP